MGRPAPPQAAVALAASLAAAGGAAEAQAARAGGAEGAAQQPAVSAAALRASQGLPHAKSALQASFDRARAAK